MTSFRYIPSDEVDKRYRAERAPTPPRQSGPAAGRTVPQSQFRNVESVLMLGSTRFITYRDRTFRIPPVPFKLGQRVLTLQIKILADAKQVAMTGDSAPADAFYKKMDQMAKLLWSHVQPLGRVRRFFWRIGFAHNPFRGASEAELKAITDFFLQGRMMSTVRSISAEEATITDRAI